MDKDQIIYEGWSSEDYINQQFGRVEKIAVKFFKNKPIEDITNQDVQEMMSWANEQNH